MRWRIFAHPNAISKYVHSVAVARLRVFTQPRPIATDIAPQPNVRFLGGELCCKSRKLQVYKFFAKTRNRKQSPIRITSIALPKSPVSLT